MGGFGWGCSLTDYDKASVNFKNWKKTNIKSLTVALGSQHQYQRYWHNANVHLSFFLLTNRNAAFTHVLISRWTAIPHKTNKTKTTGMAATVTPNSAVSLVRTTMSNFRRFSDLSAQRKAWQTHLHRHSSKAEEVKLQKTNHDLIVLVHRYRVAWV